MYLGARACGLVVSDLRSETKASQFESDCYLYVEVSSLQLSPVLCLSVCEADRNGSEDLKKCPPSSLAVL